MVCLFVDYNSTACTSKMEAINNNGPIVKNQAPGPVNIIANTADEAFCYFLFGALLFYNFYVYFKEIFVYKKKHCLRTNILLFCACNGVSLLIYTIVAREYSKDWSRNYIAFADMMFSCMGFIQWYLYIYWFALLANCSSDQMSSLLLEEDSGSSIISHSVKLKKSSLFKFTCTASIALLAFIAAGVFLVLVNVKVFFVYNAIVVVVVTLVFTIIGTRFITFLQNNTNSLNISNQSYKSIRRSRISMFILFPCATLNVLILVLNLIMGNDFFDIVETRSYSCHKYACLAMFLVIC
jgi:hypothetical protein